MVFAAAWELFENHKAEGKWDLVSIIPNYASFCLKKKRVSILTSFVLLQ